MKFGIRDKIFDDHILCKYSPEMLNVYSDLRQRNEWAIWGLHPLKRTAMAEVWDSLAYLLYVSLSSFEARNHIYSVTKKYICIDR